MAEDQKEIAARLLAELGVGSTEKMGKSQQIKLGTHKLAVLAGGFLVNQKTKQSRNPERRLVVDFVVLESVAPDPNDPPPYTEGSKIQIPFFIERAEHPGYEVSRFQDMVESMQVGLQAEGTQSDFGGRILTEEGRGIQAQLEVAQGNPHKKKVGSFYHDENWSPVAQTEDEVAELGAQLSQLHGTWKAPGETAAPPAKKPAAAPASKFLKKG